MYCYTRCPQPCSRPPLTHASALDSWTLPGKSGSVSCGVTAPFSWVLVHTRYSVCPPRVNFPILCEFWQLYGGINGDLLQEGLCHTQVSCTQSSCSCGSQLLTHNSTGDAQTQFCFSLCGVPGSWHAQGLFEPSEHLWPVRGLKFLHTISPPYHLARVSHFPLDIAYLFCVWGIQHFQVNGCSAANCSFGVLAGEDERMSFYSAILCHKHRQRHTQDKVNR